MEGIPKEILDVDLSGWRFVSIYEIWEPCEHGACCKVFGYTRTLDDAHYFADKLFESQWRAETAVTKKTLLTRDGSSGYILAIGVDIFREKKAFSFMETRPPLHPVP